MLLHLFLVLLLLPEPEGNRDSTRCDMSFRGGGVDFWGGGGGVVVEAVTILFSLSGN